MLTSGPIDPELGPIVLITIGLSFAEANLRQNPPKMKQYRASINTGLGVSVLDREIINNFKPRNWSTAVIQVPFRDEETRALATLYAAVDGFMLRHIKFMSVEKQELPSLVSCILGRDFLDTLGFIYDGKKHDYELTDFVFPQPVSEL